MLKMQGTFNQNREIENNRRHCAKMAKNDCLTPYSFEMAGFHTEQQGLAQGNSIDDFGAASAAVPAEDCSVET